MDCSSVVWLVKDIIRDKSLPETWETWSANWVNVSFQKLYLYWNVVCIGSSEIRASTSRDMVLVFTDSLVPTVRKALSDPLPEVISSFFFTSPQMIHLNVLFQVR